LESIGLCILLILLIIYLLRLWKNKDYTDEYLCLVIAALLTIIGIFFYTSNKVLELNIFGSLTFYFLSAASIVPLLRHLTPSNEDEEPNYFFLKRTYGSFTIAFFSILCFLTFASLVDSINWIKFTNLLNYLYIFCLYVIELYVLYQTKNLKFKIFVENWLTYVFIVSLTELFKFIMYYDGFLNWIVVGPTIVLFLVTRKRSKEED
jgi:hypothetical protein